MPPTRIQRKRTRGWRMPAGAVYVGRPTRWGNPFAVARWEHPMPDSPLWSCSVVASYAVVARFDSRAEAAAKAVEMFRELMGLSGSRRRGFLLRWSIPERVAPLDFAELAGRDLVCWCPLDCPCHADLLLELANGGAA